jgi:hypothetical protein
MGKQIFSKSIVQENKARSVMDYIDEQGWRVDSRHCLDFPHIKFLAC